MREIVKPDNQLRLTEAELQEEIAKMLTANNPAAPKNVARFNMKERTYKVRDPCQPAVTAQPRAGRAEPRSLHIHAQPYTLGYSPTPQSLIIMRCCPSVHPAPAQ